MSTRVDWVEVAAWLSLIGFVGSFWFAFLSVGLS